MTRYQREWAISRSRLIAQIEEIAATPDSDERDRLLRNLRRSYALPNLTAPISYSKKGFNTQDLVILSRVT